MHITKRVFELTPEHLRFARQLGVEHIIGYLPMDRGTGPFAYGELVKAKRRVESFDLRLTALGSPLKAIMDSILHARPGIDDALETVATIVTDIEHALRTLIPTGRVHVVHFRNVRRDPSAPVLRYDETFIDDGDMDMIGSPWLYAELGYDGLIDPDHAPVMEGDGQWTRERGYAYAIGYMMAVRQAIERDGP